MDIAATLNELGHKAVAEACGVDVSRVYRWTYPTDKPGGTNGRVPAEHFAAIIALAEKRGITIDVWDLVKPHEAA